MEKGSLYNLRNLINRTSIPKKPEKAMNATEDFYLVVLHAYILAAANTILQSSYNLQTTTSLAKEIVDAFIDVNISDTKPPSGDGVHEYAREMLTLLLIWHYFHDATKEGDGKRVLLVWKLLLLIYSGHRNYAKESAILLL